LLKSFYEAEDNFLSKEDVRQDVLYDENARNGTVDNCIYEARKELKEGNFPAFIETVYRRGYVLKKY
jgi:DNA-binding winged helix-turn-helix (wHTH) protein